MLPTHRELTLQLAEILGVASAATTKIVLTLEVSLPPRLEVTTTLRSLDGGAVQRLAAFDLVPCAKPIDRPLLPTVAPAAGDSHERLAQELRDHAEAARAFLDESTRAPTHSAPSAACVSVDVYATGGTVDARHRFVQMGHITRNRA